MWAEAGGMGGGKRWACGTPGGILTFTATVVFLVIFYNLELHIQEELMQGGGMVLKYLHVATALYIFG